MPIRSEDFLLFAESLDPEDGECALRMIVGRAFYGAYHAALDWHAHALPMQGHDVGSTGGIHQQLINQLSHPDSSCSKDLGFKSRSLAYGLRELKVWRTQADYYLSEVVTAERAENAKARARVLFARVNS